MMIMLWGIQPERSSACYYLLVYSVVSSYPFLCCMSWAMTTSLLLLHDSRTIWILALTLAFFVKLPVYSALLTTTCSRWGTIIRFHSSCWSAPQVRSLRHLSFEVVRSSVSLSLFDIISIFGMVIGSAIVTMQSDGKSLVAYSSICHMNFLSLLLLTSCSLGKSFQWLWCWGMQLLLAWCSECS